MFALRDLATVLVCCAVVEPAVAQEESAVVITPRDMRIMGVGALGAALLSLEDVRIARAFGDSALHTNRRFDAFARSTSRVTETVLMISVTSIWAIARLGHSDGTADFGWLKGFTSFSHRSFPSMHAMASFAAATALTQEMRERHTGYRGVTSGLLYLGAAASPAARMYLDEHWASDIALGAFLGIFAGQKVVQYSHEHPGNPIDKRFLKPAIRTSVTIDASGWSLRVLP